MNKINLTPEEILFNSFLNHLNYLCDDFVVKDRVDLSNLEKRFEGLNEPTYVVKNWFRRGYKGNLDFSNVSDGRVAYLSRCLGHKINEKVFFKYPKLCVLYSLCILKDRWREAESIISLDDGASYLYSKYVICGILPEKMHTEIVLRTFLSTSFLIRKYFENIRVYKKKNCGRI